MRISRKVMYQVVKDYDLTKEDIISFNLRFGDQLTWCGNQTPECDRLAYETLVNWQLTKHEPYEDE